MSSSVDSCLSSLAQRLPNELKQYPNVFKQLYDSKLWHELTLEVERFSATPGGQKELPLVFEFVNTWEPKMSPFSYTKIAVKTAEQLSPQEGVSLMDKVMNKYKGKEKPELKAVFILAAVECAHFHIVLGHLDKGKELLDEAKPILDNLMGLDLHIHVAYYRVASELAKAKSDYSGFYRASMSYLSYVDVDSLLSESPAAMRERAHDIIVSGLLSEEVYNFGDLLGNAKLLSMLDGTDYSYLPALLDAFNSGDLDCASRLASKVSNHPLLKTHSEFLDSKLKLMALAEGLFAAYKTTHDIPLAEVAKLCRSSIDDAESLLLDAMALELFKGRIDQVNQTLHIEWVPSQYLNAQQTRELRESFESWLEQVQQAVTFVTEQMPESVIV